MRYQSLLIVALVLALAPFHQAAESFETVEVAKDENVALDVSEHAFSDAAEDSWISEFDTPGDVEQDGELHAQGRTSLAKKKPPPPRKRKPPPPRKRPPPPRKRPPPPRKSPPPPRPAKSPPPPPNSPPPPVASSAPPPPPNSSPPRPQNFCSFPTTKKVISGRRVQSDLSGIRPCYGPRTANPSECCAQCQADPTCIAWTFTKPLDCRGQNLPVVDTTGACYLIDTYTGSYDPLQNFEYTSGRAFT